jgi:Protein of unknown function (DUF3775)
MSVIMPTLSLPADYLARLILKARGLQAQSGEVDTGSGSNPTDDRMIDAIQDTPGDLTREELRKEIVGLNDRQKAELVALLWCGRGDTDLQDWEQSVETARERNANPTETYLLGDPLVGEYWAEGAEKLGIELPVEISARIR